VDQLNVGFGGAGDERDPVDLSLVRGERIKRHDEVDPAAIWADLDAVGAGNE
jgi:hypothetical protein